MMKRWTRKLPAPMRDDDLSCSVWSDDSRRFRRVVFISLAGYFSDGVSNAYVKLCMQLPVHLLCT
jgi:hypothetical protein